MNTDLSEKLKQYQSSYYASKKINKWNTNFLYSIKMSEQTLKFGDIVVNNKEFHASKQAIALNLVDTDKVFVSDKFKYSDDGSKYFIGYLDDDDDDDDDHDDDYIIRPLCFILLQMSRYIKYFDDGGKNMFFKIEGEIVFFEYNER